MQFRATIELGGKTATGIEVPAAVVEGLGTSKRPAVRVTLNGHTYRTTVAVMGGRFLIPLSAENRAGAKVAAGEEVLVDIEVDAEPREIVVPADFADALGKDAAAKRAFDALSYSQKRWHVLSIEGAKTAETRGLRIQKFLAILRES